MAHIDACAPVSPALPLSLSLCPSLSLSAPLSLFSAPLSPLQPYPTLPVSCSNEGLSARVEGFLSQQSQGTILSHILISPDLLSWLLNRCVTGPWIKQILFVVPVVTEVQKPSSVPPLSTSVASSLSAHEEGAGGRHGDLEEAQRHGPQHRCSQGSVCVCVCVCGAH